MAIDPRVLSVPALVHGRVLLDAVDGAASLVVGFHGYGQLAEDHLEELRRLRGDHSWALAAVQALHPFYRRSDGTVAAGWMTRLDREQAIADNVAYVARAVGGLRRELPTVRRMAFVGFSQGVAMAWRAAARCGWASHALVMLAGDVPPELHHAHLPGLPPVLIGRGEDEEWYSEEKLAADLEVLRRLGIEATVCRFPGGHEWAEPFVERTRAFLGERLET